MTINMAFEDLHRPLTSAGFRGAIKWIILISGGILILQQFVGSELIDWFGLTPVWSCETFGCGRW